MEEVEESYRKEIESSENKFLNNLKKGLDLRESEVSYKKLTEKARERYLKDVSKCLEKEGKKNLIKPAIKSKETNEVFKSSTVSCELSNLDKLKIGLNLSLFRLSFGLRNLIRKKVPNNVLFLYYRIKIKVDKALSIFGVFFQHFRDKYENLRMFVRDILKKVGYIKS